MIVNWALLSHPANWLVIFLTLWLVAILAHSVYVAATTGVAPFAFPGT